ncbi:MAG: hypothetical protein ACI4P3_06145, partial [Candidatus Spyradosoma sp.]
EPLRLDVCDYHFHNVETKIQIVCKPETLCFEIVPINKGFISISRKQKFYIFFQSFEDSLKINGKNCKIAHSRSSPKRKNVPAKPRPKPRAFPSALFQLLSGNVFIYLFRKSSSDSAP